MDINLADVTVHIDESLDKTRYADIEVDLREMDGVVSVARQEKTPHILIVEFNADKLKSRDILDHVVSHKVHAELVGL